MPPGFARTSVDESTMNDFDTYLRSWSIFYTALAGGTTVLMGLIFLAVSLRLDVFTRSGLHEPKEVAWQTFINFFIVFVVSMVFLIPDSSSTAFAIILTSLSVLGVFLVVRRWARTRGRLSRGKSFVAFVPLLACYLVLATSSVWSFSDFRALVAVAPALIFLVGVAVYNAWQLLFAYRRPENGTTE